MAKVSINELYDNLKADGWVEKDFNNFEQFFFAPGQQGYKNRKALYDNMKEDGYVDSPTYEEFMSKIDYRVGSAGSDGSRASAGVSPAGAGGAQAQSAGQRAAGTPSGMVDAPAYVLRRGGVDQTVAASEIDAAGGLHGYQKSRPGAETRVYMVSPEGKVFHRPVDEAYDLVRQGWKFRTGKVRQKAFDGSSEAVRSGQAAVAQGLERFERLGRESKRRQEDQMKYLGSGASLSGGPLRDGVTVSPDAEESYITPLGERVATREAAVSRSREQRESLAWLRKDEVTRELEEAMADHQRIEEALSRRRQELDREYEEAGTGTSLLRDLAGLAQSGKDAMAGRQTDEGRNYFADKEYNQLYAALRNSRASINVLKDKHDGTMNEFWLSMGRELVNGYTFSDGLSDLRDARALTEASELVDTINSKRRSGEVLNEEEQTAEVLLRAVAMRGLAEGKYGDEYGAWARAGKMGAHSIELLKDFAMGGMVMMENATGKVLAKMGLKEAARGLRGHLLKGAGIAAGTLTGGALMTNTIQAPRLFAETAKRMNGTVEMDENGDFVIDGKEGFLTSLLKAERDLISENASEAVGAYIPGIGGAVGRVLNKVGLSKVNEIASSLAGRQWYKSTRKVLERMGFNGTLGEGLEEYAGTAYSTLMGDFESLKSLGDVNTHVDIWLGCATLGALLNTPQYVGTGLYGISYARQRRAVSRSDKAGARVFGDRWESVRSALDNADNDRMSGVVAGLLTDGNLVGNETERGALLDYARELQRFRGMNLGEMVSNGQDAEGESDVDSDGAAELNDQLRDAYEEGVGAVEAEDAEGADVISRRMREAGAAMEDAFGGEAEVWMHDIEANPWEVLCDPELTVDQQDAVLEYINARAALDGVMDASEEAAESRRAEVTESVKRRTHKDSGVIVPATMKVDNRQVYVVKGDVAMFPDGSAVDVRNSSESVVVMDAQTGEYEFASPDQIMQVSEAVDPQEEVRAAHAIIEQERMDLFGENAVAPDESAEADGAGAGETVSPAPADAEQYDLGYERGIKVAAGFSDDVLDAAIDDLRGRDFLSDEWRGCLEAYEYEQQRRQMEAQGAVETAESVPKIEENAETPTEKRELGTESVPKTEDSVENGQQTALSRVPRNEQGEPMFEQAESPETGWDALVEFSEGDAATAGEIAEVMVAQKRKVFEKAQKLKASGKTPTEIMASKKANAARLAQARSEYEQWQRIAGVEPTRQEAVRLQQQEERRLRDAEAGAASASHDTDSDYQTAEGFPIDGNGQSVNAIEGDGMIGRSLIEQEATDLIGQMESSAEVAPAIELTPENWIAQFGEDGTVETPIGIVKMGENQYFKMARQGRESKLGMVKPTLQSPDVVIEDYRPASNGESERDTSYIFVKTFSKEDGSRYYYFTSVTVRKEGREVVISNQERSDKRISKLLQQGKVAWINSGILHPKSQVGKSVSLNDSSNPTNSDNGTALLGVNSSAGEVKLSPSSERYLTETPSVSERPDLVPTSDNVSSEGKDSQSASDKQKSETENREIVYDRHTTVKQPVEAAEESQTPTPGDTSDDSRMNSPAQSEGKDNALSADKQADGGGSSVEVAENKGERAVQSSGSGTSAEVQSEPTEAQKAAGNYKMGHRRVDGYNISIENAKGSVRRGTGADGKPWETTMQNDYGYIRGTEGVDGDHIDVFLSETPEEGDVFVVDQVNEDGSFDEHKVMYGFPSEQAAREAYLSNYEPGWTGLGAITHVSKEEFKKWIGSSRRKTKPFSEYKSVKATSSEEVTATDISYSITPTTYTNKKGKTSDVHLVKFNRELTAEEKAALDTFAREPLSEGKKTSRGWYDRKQGGYMMRSEEAARQLGEMLGNEEAVADGQPMSTEELREAVKAEPEEAQHEISDEEMQSLANEIRDILGIGEEEGDTNIKFRDPGELTPQERQRLQSAGIRVAMGLISRGTTAFPDYVAKMVGMMGDKIRPWLKSFYEGARWTPGYEKYDFTPSEEVAVFDVQNFDKKQADPIAQAAMIVEERKASKALAQLAEQRKAEETHNGYKRGDEVMWDRYGNGKWEKVRIEDFDADGSPIFEAVKGIMSEKGDWSRVRPADGMFGEARRVANKAKADRKNNAKRNQQSASSLKGQDLTTGFSTADSAKSDTKVIISDKTKAKKQLEFVKSKYIGEKKSRGFLSDIAKALGNTASDAVQTRYFEFSDNQGNSYTLRLSNHNVNAMNHDGETPEISIVVKSRRQPNRFFPSEEAQVTEYVYFKEDIARGDGNTLSSIAKDIADMLETGRYADTSGIAVVNHSPATADATATATEVLNGDKVKKAANKKSIKPEQQVGDLFSDLPDEPIKDEKKTDVQPRPGTAERERGHEPQPNEPLGESQRNEVKGTDGRGMAGRDRVNPMSDADRGAGVSRKPKSQPVTERVPESERKNVRNNHAERGVDYAPKGEDARIKANIEAIELAKRLLDAGSEADSHDMAVLRRFSGWGGLGKAFNESGRNPNPTARRLRELLGEQGYQDAVDSRRSAYYTPAEVIDTMWDVARAMGFKGGNVLEGSAGIGNILGLMPADMSERSSIHAVEIDRTTGGILSLLYPDAKVEIQGFEKTRVRNGSVDLAITNVPFVTGLRVMDETGDKDLSKKFHDIHDFCIAKNIRKLREGGIGIFITSSGTMDNSKELRRWIINEGNADVVGAFRMHNKTFGGTGATSDIIVVRKRVGGKPSPNAIDVTDVAGVRVADYDTGKTRKVKGQEIRIVNRLSMDYNKYFAEHPESMAGEMRFGFEEGDTFRPKSKALYPVAGMEQGEMLTAWAERFADMEEEATAAPKVEDEVTRINERLGEGVKEGSMVLDSHGELCMARMGEAVPLGLNKNKVKGHTKAECFEAYTAIKKALSDVLEYQSAHEDNEGLTPLLKELNRAFDTFTRTYGNLHKNAAISFLRNDVDFSGILALETYSEKGDKKGNKVVKVGKTDIFSRRVIETEKEPQPSTIKDAILASLYKSGGVDVEYIGQALGKPTEEVKREIVSSGLGFENPSTGTMEVSYKYLSGNVREKLHTAQENNEGGRYDANIKALEGVLPMSIPAHLIEFALGSSWMDPKLYEDFVYEKTGLRVTLTNAGGTWFMKTPWSTFNEKNRAMAVVSKMCDKTIMGHELIESAITNKQITVSKTVKHYDGTTETITDKSATAECGIKVDEIRAEFKDWARERMQADPDMSARIEQTYNEQFNNYVPMSIPDEFVPQRFGGQVSELHGRPFALRPHQGKAVVRGTTEPILLAHEVGTGKTYTLITTAMEMRRLGTARKPMIVVQNATVGQFVESAKEIYPNAKVLTIEEADRTAEGRRNFYAKIKYNDWDMIVVPQSVFERIPDSPEREMAYVKEIIEEKMSVLEAMREADSEGRSMIVRQAERELAEQEERLAELTEAMHGKKRKRDEKREATTRQNAEVRALEMLDREVDDVENFDDMGIDAILVDEAHEYKHLGFATAMQRGVKGVDPSYSKKSQGVFLKAQAVMERNNGRNVVFATGTPISNTAAEIWTFMRYLMPVDTMKSYGIYYFDDFVRNFGNIAQMVEFGTNGKFKENNRFAGYVNLPELVRIWSGVADTVLTREAGGVSDKIPDMEGGKPQDIYLPQTRALRSVMKYVKAELDRYENMTGKEKKENSHIPLTMYGIAKAAAVDVRLVVPNAEDDPNSKTNATVRETMRSLRDSEKYKGTVAIFSDNYQNKQSGFNLYEDIRKKLIAEGVPAEQVVVIKPGMTVKKKLDIFEKVNAGEIRVIMGSTFTLGTGVNIQERLHTLIHVDAPNRPMDYTQRNGRALRQGNLHKDMGIPVRIIRFGVEDSLDVTAYQRLKTKGAIADSIMNGSKMMQNSMENRVLEEEEDSFGDMTAQLSGSEYAILKNQAEREVRSLTAKQKGHDIDQIYVHNQLPKVEGFIKGAEQRIALETKNLEIIGKHFPDGSIRKITIGKLTFDSVDAMEDFFKEQNAKMNEAAENVREGADNYTSRLAVDVDGLQFEVTTTVRREVDSNGQGSLSFEPERSVTYSCEALGIKNESVKGNRLKNVMHKIAEEIATGNASRDLLNRGQQQLAHYGEEYRLLRDRNGREFPYKAQLAEAKERLAKYEEAMKKELEEKEAKYAELDKSVETASDITLTDEDSTDTPATVEGNRFRDGGEMTDGERLRAIRELEPVTVERNNLSRAELREVYNNLPSVEKDGREIEFYRSAFKKIYKEGGLFEQVVPVLDEVLEQSVLAYTEADNLGGTVRPDGSEHKEHKNVLRFENYVGKITIDGIPYFVRTTVQHEVGQAGTHSFFVSNVDVYENPTESRTIPITSRGTTDFDGIVDAKLQQFFERASAEALELDKADRVEELSGMLGVGVRVISDPSEIDGLPSARHRRAKGYFDPATGKVVIVVPNNRDVADVENTFVHEVVGHKGLRALIGEERFEAFLGEVYDHASASVRKAIDAMTDRMVNAEADRLRTRKAQARERAGEDVNANYYADMAEARVEAEAKREELRKEATEEYMADLGGRIGSEGFARMSEEELTFWGRIKAKVQAFLDKFMQGLKIGRSIRLSDKDLSYILYRSWKNLREKRGQGGVFAEAEDAVMRYRTGFGESELRPLTSAEKAEARKESVADKIEALFDEAVSGKLTGKPVEVGKLTADGKAYLENMSGMKLKDEVSFVLNPSDLIHMYRDHFGENEKDKGNNIPLSKDDIRAIASVIAHPERIVFGIEPDGLHRKMFYFLSSADSGTYNLLEVYSDRKGNLTTKTFYKTRKAVSQRVLSLMKSEHLTSVTDGASLSDGAKLPNFFEYPTTDSEDGVRFRDGDLGLEEYITRMKAEAMQANADNVQARREAMKAIGGNLSHLRQAMARQREYDVTTVKSVADLARVLMDNGLLDDLSKYETKRILGAINNVVGRQDVSRYVQKVMDIMVDNQLRMGANGLGRLLSIRGRRVDARGVEVQGKLDPEGQQIAQVVRKSTTLPKEDIDSRIADAVDRMSSSDRAIADEATIEYAGLQIARRYVEEITESKSEEKELRDSIREAESELKLGHMDKNVFDQYRKATEEAIRQNRIERAEAFDSLTEQLGGVLSESVERAKAWREAEKQRVEDIHHNANSDMEGRPTDEHHKDNRMQKLANNSVVRFLFAPLATFDQMLRMFGRKNTRGEGYLWNRYMRGWVSATEKEYTGYRDALKVLDAKVSEVFGRKMKWGSLFGIDRKLPKASVRFMDGGEMKEHELTQGNLLYIYMADKMSDGRMKLRRMGITEEEVEKIKAVLDPRFVQLADWMQEEFLVDKRNEYNEVHKRMFGASMAAIENYFPLKILANARMEDVDVAEPEAGSQLPATATGSIIKRRRNNLALDVTGANAFSVILDHLQQMERWAAFAEFNRDLNTLLSYKRFRNQVMNMSSVYGGGKKLWNSFRDVCRMAAGAYRPPIAALDKSAVNIAKGVTAAKVSFRMFTALKQLLSMPAYVPDSNPVYLAANIANPYGAWKWASENLPLFEKRWSGRMAGDPRLLKTEMDWKMWRSRAVEIASRVGMSPNAFVDALTVSIGAHSMYQTKLAKYKRQGYDPDTAEARAKQDATILFNQTQQSSEGAFLSTMQVDRSWLSVLFTVFRNSSMSYTRQLYDSIRNLGRRVTPGYKGLSEEFMAKQMVRDGIDAQKASENAKREYRRGVIRDLVRVGIFGYGLQLAWNLGAYLPYLLLGDDDDEKESMLDDVFTHTMFGSIEGLTGGDVMSMAGNMWVGGEGNPQYLTKDMPLASDVLSILKKMDKDEASAMNDVINLLVQAGLGVNPQSLTDAAVAVMDYCGDDAATSRECALLICRILNCPQSQIDKIYFDELDATGEEGRRMTPSEIAERYARYKVRRGAPLTGWSRSEGEADSVASKQRKTALGIAKERIGEKVATDSTRELLSEYDAVTKRQSEINKLRETDREAYMKESRELRESVDMRRHVLVKRYKHDFKLLTNRYLRTTDRAEADSIVREMFRIRDRLLEDCRSGEYERQ